MCRMAAVQMTSTPNVEANLVSAESLIREAAEGGAEVVVLPENFAVFDTSALYEQGCRERDERIFSGWIDTCARRYSLWIVGGTVPSALPVDGGDARVYARCFVASPEGMVGHYDKLHLFDAEVADAQGAYRESATIAPGTALRVMETPWGGLGLSVCYDLRFPGLFQAMAAQGATWMTVPAAFTRVTGEAHWLTLLRARAIETQSFVIGANQTGRHSSTRETFGHSAIISPWGEVLSLRSEGAGVVMATLDFSDLAERRRRMPLQDHQRFLSTGPRAMESSS